MEWSEFQIRRILGYSNVSGTKPLRKRETYLVESHKLGQCGGAVKALRFKPEGREFDSR